MKTLPIVLIFVLAMLGTTSFGQDFEGTMKWKMSFEFSDPKQKAQMEKMNDPANAKQMEANPQMKEMMEKAMANLQKPGGGGLIPTGMTIKMKKGNSSVMMNGGMMDGKEIINLANKDESYSIDRKAKTYKKLPNKSAKDTETPTYKVTKTDEYQTVMGYKCRKYIVEHTNDKIKQTIWASQELKELSSQYFRKMQAGKENKSMFYKEIEGIPLKIEASTKDGIMTLEALEIKKGSIGDDEVTIPTGYTEK